MANISKKVVLFGDAGCGKNSLLAVFWNDRGFDSNTPCRLENEVIKVVDDRQSVVFRVFNTSGEKSERLVMYKGDGSEMRMCLDPSLQVVRSRNS